jgi:hypothetical protein
MKKMQPKPPKGSNAAELFARGQQIIKEGAQTQPEVPPAAVPEWVNETPEHEATEYNLMMQDAQQHWEQEVQVTRAEYIALKQHVAGLRGIAPLEPTVLATESSAPDAKPAPLSQVDPLRVDSICELERTQPEEAAALRAQLLEQITAFLPKMSTSDVQNVAQFMDLCNNNRGCVTPVENFLTELVSEHYLCGGLTPEVVMHEFDGNCDGFKTNYEETVESVARFNAAYPKQPAA